MPLAFLVIGIIFLIASVRGKEQTDLLFATLKDDFTGQNNFIFWGLSFFLIGAIGYFKPLRGVSNAFLLLLIIVILLRNKGFPAAFIEQISPGPVGLNGVK